MSVWLQVFLFVLLVWLSCSLLAAIGHCVLLIPLLSVAGYVWLLRRHRRRWLTHPTHSTPRV